MKRSRTHHLRQSLKVSAVCDGSIARHARFVTAAAFVVAPQAQEIIANHHRKIASPPTYRTYRRIAAGTSEAAARRAASTSTRRNGRQAQTRRERIRAQANPPNHPSRRTTRHFRPGNNQPFPSLSIILRGPISFTYRINTNIKIFKFRKVPSTLKSYDLLNAPCSLRH